MFLIFFVDEVFQNLHDVNILVACPDLYTSNLTPESDDYCTVNLKNVAFVLSPIDFVGKVGRSKWCCICISLIIFGDVQNKCW